jgi:hypothetical protein
MKVFHKNLLKFFGSTKEFESEFLVKYLADVDIFKEQFCFYTKCRSTTWTEILYKRRNDDGKDWERKAEMSAQKNLV